MEKSEKGEKGENVKTQELRKRPVRGCWLVFSSFSLFSLFSNFECPARRAQPGSGAISFRGVLRAGQTGVMMRGYDLYPLIAPLPGRVRRACRPRLEKSEKGEKWKNVNAKESR